MSAWLSLIGRWPLTHKLFSGIGLLVALLITSEVVLMRTASSLQEDGARITSRLQLAYGIHFALESIYGSEKLLLPSGYSDRDPMSAARKKKAKDDIAAVAVEINTLRQLTETSEQRSAVDTVFRGLSEWATLHEAVTQLADTGHFDDAVKVQFERGQPIKDRTLPVIAALVERERHVIAANVAASVMNYRRSRTVTLALVAVSLAAAALVALTVRGLVTTSRANTTAATTFQRVVTRPTAPKRTTVIPPSTPGYTGAY